MKRISIIIPVRNEAQALAENLPALQLLRAAGHELIVVDGGSSDKGAKCCDGQVDQLLSSTPGRALQMNAGAAIATGDVLLFLHIDTRLPDTALMALAQGFEHPDILWGRFDVRLSGKRRVFRLIEYMMNLRSRVSGVATGDQALFVRTAVFRQLGGFPDIPLMEDVALSKRLRQLAPPLCLRQRVTTSSRRWETHGVVQTVLLMWWLRLLYFVGIAPVKLHAMYMRKKA
jgi:rSAM/selenodomain-associated transferase 2